MRTLPISSNCLAYRNSFRAEEQSRVSAPDTSNQSSTTVKKDDKTLPIITSALALAAVVTAGIAISKNRGAGKDDAANAIKEEFSKRIKELEEKLAKAEKASDKSELLKEVSELRKILNEKAEWFDGYNKGTDHKIKELIGRLDSFEQSLKSVGLAGERGMLHIDGMALMQNMMTDKAIPVSKEMETYLRTVSGKYQRGEVELKRLKKGDVVWSPSTETDFRKTGGQGVIFTQQAKNFREVGVTEYEILAVNEIPQQGGIQSVRTELKIDDKKETIKEVIDGLNEVLNKDPYSYSYSYKGKDIKLQKAVEFPVDTYHNGKHSLEKVAVYLGEDFQTKQPVLMFENSKYFNSNQTMYGNSAGGITERERDTFIGAVMYKLEKLKRDPKSVTNYTIFNQDAYKSIKVPDAVYLHDASAAPYILAARLKAPLEAANGELSKEAADAISTKNIVAKFHNFDYRGEGYGQERADILNTLLDKYAADIYKYAETGFAEEGMHDIGKVTVSGGGTNFDNWILSLAHDGEDVSATDLAERVSGKVNPGQRSGALRHIMEVRSKAGTIHGHGNSWDRAANEVSTANLKMYNKMVNDDKVKILQAEVKTLMSKMSEAEQKSVQNPINIDNFNIVVDSLRQMDNPEVKKSLEKLDADGVTTLRQYVPYVNTDSLETIMNAKRQNKMMFVEQLRSMIKYNKESKTQLFKLSVPEELDLNSINMGNIDDVLIASFGARLVEQKNVPMLTKALKEMHSEFESRYPGKKLITVIGGPDDTAAKDYHKMLSENIGKGNISQLEFTPNPIYQSASDFTLRTSEFEPDGDLAESLYKGTPVIVTRVGGYVDRIAGTNKGILARRTPAEIVEAKEDLLTGMTKDYKEALLQGADIFFNDKPKYQSMVRDCIDSNYSWIIKDAEGKITRNCGVARDLEMLGYDLDTFPEFAKK